MRANLIKTNFTAGEISPRLMGRVDIARYANGAKIIENAVCVVQGGVVRRPGTRFAAAAKYGDRTARLIPYVFNRSQAYMLEFGDGYVRIYQNGRQLVNDDNTPYEIASPYTVDMLSEVNYVQGADTMFLVHQSVPPHRLQRKGQTDWVLEAASFIVEPFDEIRDTPEKWCKPSVKEFVGSEITLTLSDAEPADDDDSPAFTGTGWVAEDVGSYVRINSGLVLIKSITSAQVAVGTIRTDLSATQAASPGAWTREDTVWTEEFGYPGAVTLYQQRLVLAGSPQYPQTIWWSETGVYLSFELGTDDDDAISFTLSSDQLNPIVHLAQMNTLIALTYGGEFTITAGSDAAITPTNISVKNPSPYGCNSIRPVRVGTEIMFIQRAGKKLYAVAYDPDSYVSYSANDLTVLAEHITAGGVLDMAYQQQPDAFVWLIRADGVLVTMGIDRAQDVVAWSRQITDGVFESVASIPSESDDVIYVLVRREVNGQTVRYVEVFDSTLNTDSAVTGSSSEGATTWTGLSHLNGKTVDVVADGSVMPQSTVTDGQITLSRKAKKIEVGLHYETTIQTLTPEISTTEGTTQNARKRTSEVTLRFMETTGAECNGQVIPFRTFGPKILNQPAPLFTGDHYFGKLGWERGEDTLIIQQRQPLPFHLLAIIFTFSSNGG
ncbi:phage tail protein [Klebsiella pneumoniae]